MIRKHAVLLITVYDPSDTWCGLPICLTNPNVNEYLDWNDWPYKNLIPELPLESSPKPFIHSLSDVGLLRIGWD